MASPRQCTSCSETFMASGDRRVCWDCTRERRRSSTPGVHSAIDRARADGYDEGYRQGYNSGWTEGYGAGHRAREPRRDAAPGVFDREQLRELVQLCHPDRHPPERGEAANRVTSQLLVLLRECG